MSQRWSSDGYEFAIVRDGTTDGYPISTVLADPADERILGQSTMPGTYSCLLVRADGAVVLIDTGWGQAAPDGLGRVLDSLAELGVAPPSVTHVLTTHVHGDHIGGHARDGAPAFPSARTLIPRADWEWLQRRDDERAAAQREMLEPVVEAGLVDWLEDTAPPIGIEAVPTPGHTPGHTSFRIGNVLNVGDVILIEAGLAHPEVHLSFDADMDRAVETRRAVYARAAADAHTVVAFHLPEPVGVIEEDGDAWRWAPRG